MNEEPFPWSASWRIDRYDSSSKEHQLTEIAEKPDSSRGFTEVQPPQFFAFSHSRGRAGRSVENDRSFTSRCSLMGINFLWGTSAGTEVLWKAISFLFNDTESLGGQPNTRVELH